MNCLHCGAPVLINDICSECGLKQEYLIKAWNTSLYYYNEGLADAKIRNLTGAEQALKMSLRYSKANVDARNLLGLVYYESGQIVEALVQWVISSNYQPEENLATRYLTIVQGNQNRLKAYDQAAKKYNMTIHYMQQRNNDLALIQLKKVLSDNPHFVKAYLALALIYIQEGSLEKAKKALQRALKIDKYNPMAQHYLEEISKNSKQYSSGLAYNTLDDEEFLQDDVEDEETEYEDEEESAKRKIREIIERGAAAEDINPDQNLEVGSYKEIKYGRHNILYLVAGLAIGIIAMIFLIMPASVRRIRNEDLQLKSSYSAELSGKNAQISGLQEENTELQQKVSNLSEQISTIQATASQSSIDDNLMSGVQKYMSGDKQAAVQALGNIDLNKAELTEDAKSCIQAIVTDCEAELATFRSAGITAYTAENYDEAITNLVLYCNLKPDDVEARFNLAKAYEAKGSVVEANALYDDINTRFPDSEYTSTLFQ